MTPFSNDDVRAELDRLLSSDAFVNADRLSRFLRFTVERTLAGEGASIKEYLIGVEVFDRDASFDPRLDPVVRVEARRLRAKIQEYYETNGSNGPLRITYRKGSYAPLFEPSEQTKAVAKPEPNAPFAAWKLVAGLVLVAAIGGAYWMVRVRNVPSVAVFAWTNDDGSTNSIAQGTAEALTAELSRQPGMHVIAWPSVSEYQKRHTVQPSFLRQATHDLNSGIAVVISVRPAGSRSRIIAHLVDPAKNIKIWAADYERHIEGDELEVEREVSRAMADEIRAKLVR
jgi:TolB-like protein